MIPVETCQALVPTGDGWKRVCREPRHGSWAIQIGAVGAFVNFCKAHGELADLKPIEVRAREPGQALSRLWRNRAKSLNERARMHGVRDHLHPGDLRKIVERDNSRCVYCNKLLDYETRGEKGQGEASFDHIIRLADGGSNTYENVVCACRTCNQRNNKRSDEDPTGAALERLRWYLARKPRSLAA